MRQLQLSLLASALLLALVAAPAPAATLTIVNVDGPNEGFNDPTPAAPVGGHPGVTLGQQRLIAFQHAADIWGALLDSPVEIRIQSSFDPLGPPNFPACTSAGVLGAAGAIQIFANFPGAEISNIWYHVALASKLAGADLAPGPPASIADDISAFFNSDLDNPVCLGPIGWYYGIDNNHGTNIDLVAVLLHEFGHGLGFANFVSEISGNGVSGRGDIFSQYTQDVTTGKNWNQMTPAERVASAINTDKVVWSGRHVNDAVPSTLAFGSPLLRVTSPSGLGPYRVGPAVFGAPLVSPGVSGRLILGLDAADVAGPSTTDACSPLTNAAAVAGKIALVDRGTCGFVVKVKNAQNAGAIAVVVSDNLAGSPAASLGGADATITIPSARVILPAGNALKAALAGTVNVTLGLDPTVRAGAEPSSGKILLNAPNPVQSGSSISHYDPLTFPNLLMEPAINSDLPHDVDLTLEEMIDIGWFSDKDGVPDGVDSCIGSDSRSTVVIGPCDSGVPNTVFADGCRISDGIADCIRESNQGHGSVSSCISHYTNDLKKAGVISGAQKGAIQSCAHFAH
jgi:hypothetical protein